MKNFFIRRPVFAISLSVIIVLLGAISIGNLAIEQYPDITPPVVEVSATYEGADAETVNNAVATPIAESIMGVSDMLYMQSTSANDGSMTLQVTFDIGSDADLDAIFTQNNVATSTAKLPSSVVEQGVVTRKTQTGFLCVYALYSDGRYDESFLSNYAYLNLENELLKINGVGKVEIMGAEFECIDCGLKEGDNIYAAINFDRVELLDNKEDGTVMGEVVFILYKGNHYHITVLTDDGEKIYVDTNDIWDKGDIVGISIAASDLHITKRV